MAELHHRPLRRVSGSHRDPLRWSHRSGRSPLRPVLLRHSQDSLCGHLWRGFLGFGESVALRGRTTPDLHVKRQPYRGSRRNRKLSIDTRDYLSQKRESFLMHFRFRAFWSGTTFSGSALGSRFPPGSRPSSKRCLDNG